MRVEVRGWIVVGAVVSCSPLARKRRSAELNLGCTKPLDHVHRSTALKQLPLKAPARYYDLDARFQGMLGFLFNFHLRGHIEETRDISFQTISRLVVLFYIASGLAEYAPGPAQQRQIKTVRSEEKERVTIRVQAVDLNLRRARLNEFGRAFSSTKQEEDIAR